MEAGRVIAENLRTLRAERNLTLGQLSRISGISKTMLAEIEKGGSNPTINTLLKIANGLNVPYTRLMEEPEQDVSIVRGADMPEQTGETEHYRINCCFTTTHTRNFELFRAELDGGSSSTSIGHPAKAQEYLYVTAGQLQMCLNGQTYTLNAGDAMAFDSSLRHTYRNELPETAHFVILNFYPA